jgi:uncharacterized phiE125 gp8 family phage protein
MSTLGVEPTLIIPAIQYPVLPQEVVDFGRLGDQAQMETIDQLIKAATESAEHYTGLGLLTQTWSLPLPSFTEGTIILPKRPLQGVTGISYIDGSGEDQSMDITTSPFVLNGVGNQRTYGTIKSATSWPAATNVAINFVIGFGDEPRDVPLMIRRSIILMVVTWYDVRLDERVNDNMPTGSMSMLDYWRPKALA